MGSTHFFLKKIQNSKMKKIVKIVAFRGNSGNSGGGGGGGLNSNHRGTGWGKMVGDLGEPRVPLGIPTYDIF